MHFQLWICSKMHGKSRRQHGAIWHRFCCSLRVVYLQEKTDSVWMERPRLCCMRKPCSVWNVRFESLNGMEKETIITVRHLLPWGMRYVCGKHMCREQTIMRRQCRKWRNMLGRPMRIFVSKNGISRRSIMQRQ